MTNLARTGILATLLSVAAGVEITTGSWILALPLAALAAFMAFATGVEYGRVEHRRAEQWMAASGLKVCPTCHRPTSARRGVQLLADERQD